MTTLNMQNDKISLIFEYNYFKVDICIDYF